MKRIILASVCGILLILLFVISLFIFDSSLLYPLEKDQIVIVQDGDEVTYKEIDVSPDYVKEYKGVWFSDALPFITKNKLKKYMRQNDLVINHGEYHFKNTIRIDELKEVLDFSKSS